MNAWYNVELDEDKKGTDKNTYHNPEESGPCDDASRAELDPVPELGQLPREYSVEARVLINQEDNQKDNQEDKNDHQDVDLDNIVGNIKLEFENLGLVNNFNVFTREVHEIEVSSSDTLETTERDVFIPSRQKNLISECLAELEGRDRTENTEEPEGERRAEKKLETVIDTTDLEFYHREYLFRIDYLYLKSLLSLKFVVSSI